jgi:hypothetical protein
LRLWTAPGRARAARRRSCACQPCRSDP